MFPIEVYNSPNQYSRKGYKPIVHVFHITDGERAERNSDEHEETAVYNTFMSPNSDASAHFEIHRDGLIRQYVDIRNSAWTQGLSPAQIPRAPSPIVRGMGVNPNYYCIGYEFTAYGDHGGDGAITEEQIIRALWLVKKNQTEVQQYYGFKQTLNSSYVIGHCDIDPVDRKYDPGPMFPWSRLYRELAIADSMSLEAYEEHLQYSSSISSMRADLYAFFERMADLDTKYRGSEYSAEAARKIMLMEPVMYDLGLREEATVESIIKRVSEIKKVAIVDGKWHDEGIRKASLGANYAKECGIL